MEPDQLAELMRRIQYGAGTGQGGMDIKNRVPNDPRLDALQQYMQMQGGGQMPPQMPQQQMRRGRVVPQSGHDVEDQVGDAYDATPDAQQAASERSYGRIPPPPDRNAAFANAPSGPPDEEMLRRVQMMMDQQRR